MIIKSDAAKTKAMLSIRSDLGFSLLGSLSHKYSIILRAVS